MRQSILFALAMPLALFAAACQSSPAEPGDQQAPASSSPASSASVPAQPPTEAELRKQALTSAVLPTKHWIKADSPHLYLDFDTDDPCAGAATVLETLPGAQAEGGYARVGFERTASRGEKNDGLPDAALVQTVSHLPGVSTGVASQREEWAQCVREPIQPSGSAPVVAEPLDLTAGASAPACLLVSRYESHLTAYGYRCLIELPADRLTMIYFETRVAYADGSDGDPAPPPKKVDDEFRAIVEAAVKQAG